MAASTSVRFSRLLSLNLQVVRTISTCQARLSDRKILPFEDERVKSILKRVTGCDIEKVFSKRHQDIPVPSYKVMADEELLDMDKKMKIKAESLLEFPPVMEERQEINEVLEIDERLAGYDTSDYVFTDISPSVSDRSRRIVVREPSGRLRSGTWSQRDYVNVVYHPKEGRKWEIPEMLTESGMEVPFSQHRHEDILDLICVQCEPDMPDYIRVHEAVYDDIDRENKFELLWSTRHFGGLVYYLMKHRRLDNLLDYFTGNELFDEAVDVINFHHLVYPDHKATKQSQVSNLSGTSLLRAYLKTQGPLSSLKIVEEKFFQKNVGEQSTS